MTYDWKKIEPDVEDIQNSIIWDFDKDEEFIGKFLEVSENVGPHSSKVYRFKTASGDDIAIWGNTVLNTRLKMVNVGNMVRIVYVGEKKSGNGRSYKNFDVYIDQTNKDSTKDSVSEIDAKFPDKEDKKDGKEEIDPDDIPF